MFRLLLLLIGFSALSCASRPTFRIHEKPIAYDAVRDSLSLQYLQQRHGLDVSSTAITPEMIVVHWTAVPTLEATYEVFNPVLLGGRPELSSASALNVSAHFLVDRNGSIWRLLPDTAFGRHTIGLNYMAIGIENIGGPDAPLTRAQLKANAALIEHLQRRHNIRYVIGHHEYEAFKDSPLWKETDPDYITKKQDPGDAFMRRLRKKLGRDRFQSQP
ncbi:N-acetylmuramyl-L-alanine amidase, negative regulator of AmpC, AmpD [Nitritalea halalkaliphila LW7]|uniref:N-acetylmuramoyl-L-alanine amidase n=1 Tax=Nitritalea halalkaliphila LW7 TaxID=1189621 RepID=I5C4Z6_9BACT|nr:peptidoglycan recognition family protein [Nitritalea halalkaliphila]EIM76898.1 N-acetylmuramyl-L-alanine amidase, negative regulator of AmpC, AmpD [Nitritalea halalkaliphila LW7]